MILFIYTNKSIRNFKLRFKIEKVQNTFWVLNLFVFINFLFISYVRLKYRTRTECTYLFISLSIFRFRASVKVPWVSINHCLIFPIIWYMNYKSHSLIINDRFPSTILLYKIVFVLNSVFFICVKTYLSREKLITTIERDEERWISNNKCIFYRRLL